MLGMTNGSKTSKKIWTFFFQIGVLLYHIHTNKTPNNAPCDNKQAQNKVKELQDGRSSTGWLGSEGSVVAHF